MAQAKKLIEADVQIDSFVETLRNWLKKSIAAGKPAEVSAITTDDQAYNAPKSDQAREKFHAMIGDIQKTGVIKLPNKTIKLSSYDNEQLKALLVMWFANEISETNEIVLPNPPQTLICPITGERYTIRPSTTKWGKKLTGAFIEWLYATGTLASVKWSEAAIAEYSNYKEAQQ